MHAATCVSDTWTSISEGLPTKNGYYLVHYKLYEEFGDYSIGILPFICDAEAVRNSNDEQNSKLRSVVFDLDDNGNTDIKCFCVQRHSYEEWWYEPCLTVTHWMELPNTPVVK